MGNTTLLDARCDGAGNRRRMEKTGSLGQAQAETRPKPGGHVWPPLPYPGTVAANQGTIRAPKALRKSDPRPPTPPNPMNKVLLIARIVAGLPLLAIGVMHITGSAPMGPILEGANMPNAEITAQVAPIVEILAGLLLISGLLARPAALLAIASMGGALATHLRFDHTQFEWADEPPMVLPIIVLGLSLLILAKGPGCPRLGGKKAD